MLLVESKMVCSRLVVGSRVVESSMILGVKMLMSWLLGSDLVGSNLLSSTSLTSSFSLLLLFESLSLWDFKDSELIFFSLFSLIVFKSCASGSKFKDRLMKQTHCHAAHCSLPW